MVEQEIERKIEDFRELGIQKYIPREGRLQLVDSMVSTVIGSRRAGKSFRTLQATVKVPLILSDSLTRLSNWLVILTLNI